MSGGVEVWQQDRVQQWLRKGSETAAAYLTEPFITALRLQGVIAKQHRRGPTYIRRRAIRSLQLYCMAQGFKPSADAMQLFAELIGAKSDAETIERDLRRR